MRAAVITAYTGSATFIGGYALPIVFPHASPIVAEGLLWLAGALMFVAFGLWVWDQFRPSVSRGAISQNHSGSGHNIVMSPVSPVVVDPNQSQKDELERLRVERDTADMRESIKFRQQLNRFTNFDQPE